MKFLFVILGLVALTGCTSTTSVAWRTMIEPCPVAPPAASCPAWPVESPQTLADAIASLGVAWSAWDACHASVDAWERAWNACAQWPKEKH